jgi:hypothetical protein
MKEPQPLLRKGKRKTCVGSMPPNAVLRELAELTAQLAAE